MLVISRVIRDVPLAFRSWGIAAYCGMLWRKRRNMPHGTGVNAAQLRNYDLQLITTLICIAPFTS